MGSARCANPEGTAGALLAMTTEPASFLPFLWHGGKGRTMRASSRASNVSSLSSSVQYANNSSTTCSHVLCFSGHVCWCTPFAPALPPQQVSFATSAGPEGAREQKLWDRSIALPNKQQEQGRYSQGENFAACFSASACHCAGGLTWPAPVATKQPACNVKGRTHPELGACFLSALEDALQVTGGLLLQHAAQLLQQPRTPCARCCGLHAAQLRRSVTLINAGALALQNRSVIAANTQLSCQETCVFS